MICHKAPSLHDEVTGLFICLFPVSIQLCPINRDLFEWGVGSWEWGVVVEILRISNKIKSGTDLHRHSQLPTSNFKLLDKFQFEGSGMQIYCFS